MFARKENKEYKINESMKSAYLNEGYDIYNEDGEIIEYSPKKTITMNEHLKEVAKLKEELETVKTKTSNEELTNKITELEKDLAKANEVPKNAKDLKVALDDANKRIAELEVKVQELTPEEPTTSDNDGKVQE